MAENESNVSERTGASESNVSGRTGGRGRGRYRLKGGRSGRGGDAKPKTTTFKGATAEMDGNVFECYDEQSDRRQYAKTLEALEAYAKKTLKFSEDLLPLFSDDMTMPTIEVPNDPGPNASRTRELIFGEELKEFVKRERTLKSNLAAIYAVAWGQCSEAMKAKIKSLTHYKTKAKENDCHWLLKQIKAVTLQFDEKRDVFQSLLDARESLLRCKQKPGQTNDEYLESVRGWADTIEYHGGLIGENFLLIPKKDEDGNERSDEERMAISRDRTLAGIFIRGADPTRYGTLIAELSNMFAMGNNQYPEDLSSAYSLLVNYKTPVNTRERQQQTQSPKVNPETSALTFAQKGTNKLVAGTDGTTREGVQCYNCDANGHYATACPQTGTASKANTKGDSKPDTTGTTLAQYAFMLAQTSKTLKGAETTTGIDPSWILLDSQSTISVFCNPSMLTNIRKSKHVLRAITNGGFQESDMVGEFPNLGTVWYNKDSIANILSLSEVRKVCRVTMDTEVAPALNVHRLDGSIMKFVEHPSGLYVYNSNPVISETVSAYTMVSTVAQQKALFSNREIQAADAARALYRKLGRPSEQEFQHILRQNFIRNCPVTPDDAKRALLIYGPDIATIKGKLTRTAAAPHVPSFVAQPIPAPILEHHRNVTLCVDFFFVQGIAFLHTISRGIGFRTVSLVKDRGKATILRELRAVFHLYTSRGLTICDVHGDHEFQCIREDIRPVHLNVVSADSHVGEVERSIRTIKERLRSCVHGLPFKRLPRLLIQHMVADVVHNLNQFPWRNGISSTLSPATIVLGTTPVDYNSLRIEFGSYAQVFEDNDPSNTPRARSLGAIALNPTGNAQGDYYFLSLATGGKVSRHHWIPLPITDAAIARVEALALQDGQPLIQERGLVVEWRHDQSIDESEYDLDFLPNPDTPDDVLDDDDYDPIDPHELDELLADVPPHDAPAADDYIALDQGAPEDNGNDNIDDNVIDHIVAPTDNQGAPDQGANVADNQGAPDQGANANPIELAEDNAPLPEEEQNQYNELDQNQGALVAVEQENEDHGFVVDGDAVDGLGGHENADGAGPYNLRPRKAKVSFNEMIDNPYNAKSYYPPTTNVHCASEANNKQIFGFVMTQMTARAGIKKHGKDAERAIMEEYAQLEALNVFEALDPTELTKEQKKSALRAINLLKEKKDGRLKGRTVADGRPQRTLYDKSQTASPTVSTDGLMVSIISDAYEGRDVATADVAGAYLKAKMDDFVIMKFTGESVDLLCETNSAYTSYVVVENGIKTLYVRLNKAIYGCVKSALLWYEVFQNALKELGFEINPYDPCVANKTIEGSQCTVAWYVDDTKISHKNPDVVTSVIESIEKRFGKMTVTRGKEHIFLGMKIKYTDQKTAIITMKNYLEEAINESKMNIERVATTPAKKTLFEVDDSISPLPKVEAEIFHSVVAKLLYVATRARPDILLPVGFLCTRVSKCTAQDQCKLKRLLEYIKGTLDLEYIIGSDHMSKLRSWVDASYAVHPDMRSHTGGVMSLGIGGIVCKSSKQKLNTKSSTEAELVGASDYLPNTIWIKLFLEAQGYRLEETILEQDNESAIKLETNGRMSAGQKSRHIDIRFFWIKDRTKQNNIVIRHCPTLQMLADFFTKPLQGSLFVQFRAVLLGHTPISSLTKIIVAPTAEERVGEERLVGTTTEQREQRDMIQEVEDAKKNDEDAEKNDDGFITVVRRRKQSRQQSKDFLKAILSK